MTTVWVATIYDEDDPILAVFGSEQAADTARKEARRIRRNWIRRGWTDPQPDPLTRWLPDAHIEPWPVTNEPAA